MKSALQLMVLIAAGMSNAHAVCGVQSVEVSSGKLEVGRWDVVSPEIHRLTLPNGFALGLQIEPASPEKSKEIAKKLAGYPPVEWVKISLYDLRGPQPKQLTYTWGGANSYQGYGPGGGADRVREIGEPGIELKLTKPKCANTHS
ncbi:hypothetical protein GJ699_04900 [Duganella sp. FT80W]|uniref:Uncharacterized protein n=1 Tax=Duganella guangzhouensis TaxID=2666084 RepID=A0A6I2KTP0_9BURK|nr:hypothetical protein [Duganella guangzhouensis]MRW89315.1 hypothetical protein [Duganella guangzhouensis]